MSARVSKVQEPVTSGTNRKRYSVTKLSRVFVPPTVEAHGSPQSICVRVVAQRLAGLSRITSAAVWLAITHGVIAGGQVEPSVRMVLTRNVLLTALVEEADGFP